ncbi:hypothetical protein PsorP6_014569 [Peronosclerospora sorghi]|uniref:Uncharacterized protein n=1 Tax=Peronosclerospora sorghi TaxID=230839 RepID=A0ACC0VR57_9STRA|nr:hypothetical protein PsorP6_014569 [Peronosclerospora sorghi]
MHKFNSALKSRESKITALREQINAVEDEIKKKFADFSEAVGIENIRAGSHHKALEMHRKITEHVAKLCTQIEYLDYQDFIPAQCLQKTRKKGRIAAFKAEMMTQLAEKSGVTELDDNLTELQAKLDQDKEMSRHLTDRSSYMQEQLKKRTHVEKEDEALVKGLKR